MKGRVVLSSVLILACTLLCVQFASAQAGRGRARLAGNVLDEEGNPIASAKVTLDLLGRGQASRETASDIKGEWNFMGLGSGLWRLTISADGFIPGTRDINVSQISKNPKVSLTLKKAVVETFDDDLELIDEASQLFDERKYDAALALLQEFLEKNPEAYPTHINIGDCYKEKGDYEKAEAEYRLALEAAQTDEKLGKEMTAKATAGIGDIYLKKGDFDNAQNLFKESIELLPDNEILAYNVGEIYFSNQNLDEAIYYYEVAVQIRPDWSLPFYRRGLVYLNKADYANASADFKKFLELDPESELADSVRGMLEYIEKIKK